MKRKHEDEELIILVASNAPKTFSKLSLHDFVNLYTTCKKLHALLASCEELWKVFFFNYFPDIRPNTDLKWKQNFHHAFELSKSIASGKYSVKKLIVNPTEGLERIHLGYNYLSLTGSRYVKAQYPKIGTFSSLVAIDHLDLSPLMNQDVRRVETDSSKHIFIEYAHKVEIFDEITRKTQVTMSSHDANSRPLVALIEGQTIDNDLILTSQLPSSIPGQELLSMKDNIAITRSRTDGDLFAIDISPKNSRVINQIKPKKDLSFLYAHPSNKIFSFDLGGKICTWDPQNDHWKSFQLKGLDMVPDKAHVVMNEDYVIFGDNKKQLFVLESKSLQVLFKLKKIGFMQMAIFHGNFLVIQSSRSLGIRDLKKEGELLYSIDLKENLGRCLVSNQHCLACLSENVIFLIEFLHRDCKKEIPETSCYNVEYL